MQRDDLDALHRVLGDAEAMTYYDHPFSVDETRAWIDWNLANYMRYGYGLWGCVLKESGEVIGDCGLTVQLVDGDSLVEAGWHTRHDLWGLGLATEAATAVRDHAFVTVGLDQLVSLVDRRNRASCRVAEKIGMRLWKTTTRPDGDVRLVFQLLRAEGLKLAKAG